MNKIYKNKLMNNFPALRDIEEWVKNEFGLSCSSSYHVKKMDENLLRQKGKVLFDDAVEAAGRIFFSGPKGTRQYRYLSYSYVDSKAKTMRKHKNILAEDLFEQYNGELVYEAKFFKDRKIQGLIITVYKPFQGIESLIEDVFWFEHYFYVAKKTLKGDYDERY